MMARYSILDTRRQLPVLPSQVKFGAARRGITLIETVMAMLTAAMVMTTAAMLVHSGYKSWNRSYKNANGDIRLDALDTMVALGAIGRKSNKVNYRIYDVADDTFMRVLPLADPEEVVIGDAVEFRYWDDELSDDLMNPNTTATAYALFYLEDAQLKLDFGDYPPGGVDEAGHRRTVDITTVTMADNVTLLEFSHTTRNMAGDGKGCVRMKLTLTDPDDGESKTFIAATLMRNVWPQ